MRVDVTLGTDRSRVAVKVNVADIAMAPVRVMRQIRMPARASLVRVFVAMRVDMPAAVTVRVGVHAVGVVVVSGSIRMRSISVILIPRICVIAMAVVQMIWVGHVPVVLVRGGFALVVVIAMLHIPVIAVRRVLVGSIEMAHAIAMI